MGNDKLQTLSQQYVRGEIAKPEYRQKRARIIDEVTGAHPRENIAAEPEQIPPLSKLPDKSNLYLKAGVISAVVIGALILVFSIM